MTIHNAKQFVLISAVKSSKVKSDTWLLAAGKGKWQNWFVILLPVGTWVIKQPLQKTSVVGKSRNGTETPPFLDLVLKLDFKSSFSFCFCAWLCLLPHWENAAIFNRTKAEFVYSSNAKCRDKAHSLNPSRQLHTSKSELTLAFSQD